jgi:hypothetical protein
MKKMKKLLYCFNWAMFIVLVWAFSSLDNPSWTPTIIAVVSGLMLVGGAYILEQIKLHEESVKEYE